MRCGVLSGGLKKGGSIGSGGVGLVVVRVRGFSADVDNVVHVLYTVLIADSGTDSPSDHWLYTISNGSSKY